jgi:hypothetical protein
LENQILYDGLIRFHHFRYQENSGKGVNSYKLVFSEYNTHQYVTVLSNIGQVSRCKATDLKKDPTHRGNAEI